MTVLGTILLLISATLCTDDEGLTSVLPVNIEQFENIAHFDDGQHRGNEWYDFTSEVSEASDALETDSSESSDSISSSSSSTGSSSDEASSDETKERKQVSKVFRTCTPCPHDKLKTYKNIGIKWICGGYQRARRTFKSECMMRYRNCQDGTMFIKLYDHRCQNDSYHGHHWFYIYKV